MKFGREHSKDRYYKVGDAIRWTPVHAMREAVEARGLGIIVEADGPIFEAYWTGDGKVRKADCRPISHDYALQDLAPIPQVKEYLEQLQHI